MHPSFRISLLYLLLVIPQHGNNPIPDMESWLKKDQDDGSMQHDLTSSLTGRDESFGSAHQTYQNSLISEKKSQELPPQPKEINNFKGNERIKRHGAYRLGPTNQKFQSSESMNPRLKNKFFRDNKYVEVIPSENLFPRGRMNNFYEKEEQEGLEKDMEMNPRLFNRKRLKQRRASDPFLYYPQSVDYGNLNYHLQDDYLNYDDRRGREISDEEYKNFGKSPQFDENDYYDLDVSPVLGEEDMSEEDYYNQLVGGRAYVRKKNEAKQAMQKDVKSPLSPFGYKERDERLMNYPGLQDRASATLSGFRSHEVNSKTSPDNYRWKNSNGLTQDELRTLMKDSQKAIQQIQMFQNKLVNKPQEINDDFGAYKRQSRNPFRKCEKRNYLFDGTRLKREDEDEQKNMKTGTDEGGGEYEDEEGKGHKDEEEYYEDADFSESKKKGVFDEQDQKYVKREITQDVNLKREKEDLIGESEDYDLSLKNAPIENAEKSRKSSFREGEKTNKNTARKGVKIWDQWGKWSACSVTCGIGRSTRWRHCIGGGCAQGEKEAQIKRCTNPAC